MTTSEQLAALLDKPTWNAEDRQQVYDYLEAGEVSELMDLLRERYEYDLIHNQHEDEERVKEIYGRLEMRMHPVLDTAAIYKIPFWRRYRWVAAAAVLLLIGSGTYFIISRTNEKPSVAAVHYKGDVQPGHTGAILHLSNGNTIVLDSAKDGTVATQGSMQAVKVNGELKYLGKTTEVIYNTVSTDRGRQWQLTLPDGTKVWLNAASSIHYPLSFTGNEREVEITGEAYFEVVHNSKQPFKVKVAGQVINDIGTSFNVNAYPDEPSLQTTLVDGVINVNGTTLKPGQQASLVNNQIRVSAANVEQALAWKNGAFSFDNADIYTVMRQLSRWYNVEVVYEGEPDTTPFKGEMGRSLTLAQVLKVLESLHVHFRIEEDKRIVILP